jgi:hypothetical protein
VSRHIDNEGGPGGVVAPRDLAGTPKEVPTWLRIRDLPVGGRLMTRFF